MYRFDSVIRDLRYDNKITQKELAKIIGVSQQTISMWEAKKAYPDAQSIIAICKYFNLNSDYLLGLDNSNKRRYVRKSKKDIPCFNTSELRQVRSILDFLEEEKKK